MKGPLIPRDTDREAWKMQMAAFRRMSGSQRTGLALRMSQAMRETIRAGIRDRHPDYNEDHVHRALFKALYGKALYREVFGSSEHTS